MKNSHLPVTNLESVFYFNRYREMTIINRGVDLLLLLLINVY